MKRDVALSGKALGLMPSIKIRDSFQKHKTANFLSNKIRNTHLFPSNPRVDNEELGFCFPLSKISTYNCLDIRSCTLLSKG